MINFGGTQANKKAAQQVEKWVRKQLLAGVLVKDPLLQVIAKEVRCGEPDCVPIETLVILVSSLPSDEEGGRSWRWTGKILKPVAEVEQRDVLLLDLPLNMQDESVEEEEDIEKDEAPDEEAPAMAGAGAEPQAAAAQGEATPALKAVGAAGSVSVGVNTALRPGKTGARSVFRLNAADPEQLKQEQREAHKKGVRPRGCPCCDPDNLDNIIDNFMFHM